jgi:hypothetical protein
MLNALISIMEQILTFKHSKETLFSTYWSSDGLVGRRYDYGTNVKLYYAFNGLGIEIDAVNHVLTINPKGLPENIRISPAKAFPFEVSYDENAGRWNVKNLSPQTWKIKAFFRTSGYGAEGKRNTDMMEETVPSGGEVTLERKNASSNAAPADTFSQKNIVSKELSAFGKDGVMFICREITENDLVTLTAELEAVDSRGKIIKQELRLRAGYIPVQ